MAARALFGERVATAMPPVHAAGGIDELIGVPDLCAGLFGEPRTQSARAMRDYYRLLAIRAQARS